MNSSHAQQLPQGLREIFSERKDTEGNLIALDFQYELTNGRIDESINFLKEKHGQDILLIPIGGQSAGSGVFCSKKTRMEQIIIGLVILPPTSISEQNNIDYTISNDKPTFSPKTHELHIDKKNQIAYIGAGVVLDQIIGTVKAALGNSYHIEGTDLTSSGYASAGATFMTGGMGPSRKNFAQSVIQISYFNGYKTILIEDAEELIPLQETYGWTGIIESIAVPIIQVPSFEFGFALPINNTATELSHLMNYFADKTYTNDNVFISGLELITSSALDLLNDYNPDLKGLTDLVSNCKLTNKDAVIFVSGMATKNPFEDMADPLNIFVDNKTSGLSIEQATPFNDLQAMKNIREGAPDLARQQFTHATYTYKHHTDINIIPNRDQIKSSMKPIIECYEHYKSELEKILFNTDDLEGNVQVYGHINPQGFDPHYRLTLASENKEILRIAKTQAKNEFTKLVQNLTFTCKKTGSTLCGGEKGIISNIKIMNAISEKGMKVPQQLSEQYNKQQTAIAQAHTMFNWRSKI